MCFKTGTTVILTNSETAGTKISQIDIFSFSVLEEKTEPRIFFLGKKNPSKIKQHQRERRIQVKTSYLSLFLSMGYFQKNIQFFKRLILNIRF